MIKKETKKQTTKKDLMYCKDFPCKRCGEEAVFGDWIDDVDYDNGGVHRTVHGYFECYKCGYKFSL
jgi:transcription elongation factor Elf1